jgi:ElaB/YqjD/DUF883 family membrane-anchored ribosome-binding protein
MKSQVKALLENSETATRAVDTVAPAIQSAAQRVAEAKHKLADAAARGLDTLSERRHAAVGACRDTVVARPLRAVGVAVIAGIVLGALLRR